MPKKPPRRASTTSRKKPAPARRKAAKAPARKKAAPASPRRKSPTFSKSASAWAAFFRKLAQSPTPPAISIPPDDTAMFNSVGTIRDALTAHPALAAQLERVGIDAEFLAAGEQLARPLDPEANAFNGSRKVILPEEAQQIQTAAREYQDVHKAAVGAARIVAPARLKDFGLVGSYSLSTAKGVADAITKLLNGLKVNREVLEHAAIDDATLDALRAHLKTLGRVDKAKAERAATKKNATLTRNQAELALACWLDTYRTRVGSAFKGPENLENRRTLLEALPRKVERRALSPRASRAAAEKLKASTERLKAATEKLKSVTTSNPGDGSAGPTDPAPVV